MFPNFFISISTPPISYSEETASRSNSARFSFRNRARIASDVTTSTRVDSRWERDFGFSSGSSLRYEIYEAMVLGTTDDHSIGDPPTFLKFLDPVGDSSIARSRIRRPRCHVTLMAQPSLYSTNTNRFTTEVLEGTVANGSRLERRWFAENSKGEKRFAGRLM